MAIKRPDQLTQVTGITNDDIFIVQTDVSNADVTQRAVGYIKKSDIVWSNWWLLSPYRS